LIPHNGKASNQFQGKSVIDDIRLKRSKWKKNLFEFEPLQGKIVTFKKNLHLIPFEEQQYRNKKGNKKAL
jgi:hypothetical protein